MPSGDALRAEPLGRIVRYLDGGRLKMGTNTVERATRPVTVADGTGRLSRR